MTRLTNDIRKKIVNDAIEESFKSRVAEFKKREHDLGMELYNSIFDEKVIRAAQEFPEKWLRMDSCLQFNCGGYRLTFRVSPSVPVPYSSGCAVLGNVSGDLSDRAQAYADSLRELNKEGAKARLSLEKMLESVSSVKRLQQIWPEGQKFYQFCIQENGKPGLPAVQVGEINKLLGLAA